jgi:hypothetical protein
MFAVLKHLTGRKAEVCLFGDIAVTLFPRQAFAYLIIESSSRDSPRFTLFLHHDNMHDIYLQLVVNSHKLETRIHKHAS